MKADPKRANEVLKHIANGVRIIAGGILVFGGIQPLLRGIGTPDDTIGFKGATIIFISFCVAIALDVAMTYILHRRWQSEA